MNGNRLLSLRSLLRQQKLDGYYIPSCDAHQSEYIADCDSRRAFISGFTGSAGFAIVTLDRAALWTDGRYFLQASKQLDSNWVLMKQGQTGTLEKEEWVLQSFSKPSSRLGMDPRLVTVEQADKWKTFLEKNNHELVLTTTNLVDEVWGQSQPKRVFNAIKPLDIKYCGQSCVEKVDAVRQFIKGRADAYAVTSLDEIAWLLNFRGSDIPFNPVSFAYLIVSSGNIDLFVDKSAVGDDLKEHLLPLGVNYHDYSDIFSFKHSFKKVLGASTCNAAVSVALKCQFEIVRSPITSAKAIKNSVELQGFRDCHLKDAAALCNFFGWLEAEVGAGRVIDECLAAEKCKEFRSHQEGFAGMSFETISSVGPNAAIIHYKPEKNSCSVIDSRQIYLCDSGAQYINGTTDVTRTLHFGKPTDFEKKAFTRVLQGHIQLDSAVFPPGTTGYLLDPLARIHLWQEGLDYRHGTGHGVGHFLNVHEGPHGIGTRVGYNDFPLLPGMTVTNEPGFYEDGQFGVRIENILLIKEAKTAHQFTEKPFLCFENVTFVPICRNLIAKELLDSRQLDWINSYHHACWEKVSSRLTADSLGFKWLFKETRPL